MKKIEFFAFIIFAVVIGSFGQIRTLEIPTYPGDEIEAHVNIVNRNMDSRADATRLTMFIPELGVWVPFGDHNVRYGRPIGKMIHYQLGNDVEPGEYLVRFRTESQGIGHSKYRHIIVE